MNLLKLQHGQTAHESALPDIAIRPLSPALTHAAQALWRYDLDMRYTGDLHGAAASMLAAMPVIDGSEDGIRQIISTLIDDVDAAHIHNSLHQIHFSNTHTNLGHILPEGQKSRVIIIPVTGSASYHTDAVVGDADYLVHTINALQGAHFAFVASQGEAAEAHGIGDDYTKLRLPLNHKQAEQYKAVAHMIAQLCADATNLGMEAQTGLTIAMRAIRGAAQQLALAVHTHRKQTNIETPPPHQQLSPTAVRQATKILDAAAVVRTHANILEARIAGQMGNTALSAAMHQALRTGLKQLQDIKKEHLIVPRMRVMVRERAVAPSMPLLNARVIELAQPATAAPSQNTPPPATLPQIQTQVLETPQQRVTIATTTTELSQTQQVQPTTSTSITANTAQAAASAQPMPQTTEAPQQQAPVALTAPEQAQKPITTVEQPRQQQTPEPAQQSAAATATTEPHHHQPTQTVTPTQPALQITEPPQPPAIATVAATGQAQPELQPAQGAQHSTPIAVEKTEQTQQQPTTAQPLPPTEVDQRASTQTASMKAPPHPQQRGEQETLPINPLSPSRETAPTQHEQTPKYNPFQPTDTSRLQSWTPPAAEQSKENAGGFMQLVKDKFRKAAQLLCTGLPGCPFCPKPDKAPPPNPISKGPG